MRSPAAASTIVRRRARDFAVAMLGRYRFTRRAAARSVRRVLTRNGLSQYDAASAILDEAVRGADDRELKRTLEMMKWARAIASLGPFPRWFPAAHHITTTAGRQASAAALRPYLEGDDGDNEYLWRQLFAFESSSDLGELQTFVETDLGRRLGGTAPHDVPGVERGAPPSLDLLVDVVATLTAAGLRPFLVSGTLLGHVRTGSILAHDYDIDLGLLPGEGDHEEIAAALRRVGYTVKADRLKVVCRTPDGAAVDIFLHYRRDGRLWHGTDIHEWWNSEFSLEPTSFMGIDVWVPDDVDTYLTENYGNWRRPVAFYDFSFDTPNRVYRRSPEALLYLHKRFVRGIENGDRWSTESVARELRKNFGVDVTAMFNPTPLLESGGPES